MCALGISQISRLGEFKEKKRSIFQTYIKLLQGINGIQLPSEREYVKANWHLFPVRVDPFRREAIFTNLRKEGIGVQVNYIPAYWHPVFKSQGFNKGMYPNSDVFYSEEISLPMYASLSKSQLFMVSEAIKGSLAI